MSLWIPLAVVVASGFVSLSYEIVWFRAYAFVTGGTAPSFGVVLGVFLAGIALGSAASGRFCKDETAIGDRTQLRLPALLMLAASIGGFLLIPTLGWLVRHFSFVDSLPLVALVAGLLGAVLPLVAHFGIPPDAHAGRRLSYLYLGNIAGSAAGSLLTGFVLLDITSLQTTSTLLGLLGVVIAAALLVASRPSRRALAIGLTVCVAVGVWMAAGASYHYDAIHAKLQFRESYRPSDRFAEVRENRSGIITVSANGDVYGGGVYDGGFSTDLIHDRNLIIRPYALSAVVLNPKRVMMIGLASGSWAQVLAHNPDVESLVVLEINPGYTDLIRTRAEVSDLLDNPKVRIVIDDARRWLLANPNERFDAIVNNATFHWRGHLTNLLASEFLELAAAHLNPGGRMLFNTTWSGWAQKTGCTVFGHGVRIVNMVALGRDPVRIDRPRWRANLERYAIAGKPVFDLSRDDHRARLEEVLTVRDRHRPDGGIGWYETCESILVRTAGLDVITEDNMRGEFYRPWWAVPTPPVIPTFDRTRD